MATGASGELFEYTRGRFLLDEANQMARRRVHFNMTELASVAAKSAGAEQCVEIEKCPDGFEVATMDFARNVLRTPTPHVYAWDACWGGVGSNTVGAEFIIMEKVPGSPLSAVWWKLQPREKLKILLQVVGYQKRWVDIKFTKFGSLYYAESKKSCGGES
ncbi:hypothetical protein AJ80_07839 [Polytolypa hystricis UAMH7299]|uniref:Uncharacterized protein n=1 Tax=Polytolypa hystricis (strain UAMH7299) TaxID=1447883 RepID=A0A2B7XHY0_POLH7|nr:hypothetical protein AJ80_07839 [Polytolypa hystricis UAMH7299]